MENRKLLEDLGEINDYLIERRLFQARQILTKLRNKLKEEIEKEENGKDI